MTSRRSFYPGLTILLPALVLAIPSVGIAGRHHPGPVTLRLVGPTGAGPAQRQVAFVSADSGEVVLGAALDKRRIALQPSPGVLFATASVVGVRGARGAVSRVLRVDPARASVVELRLRPATGARSSTTGAVASGVTNASGASSPPVVTMSSIPVTDQGADRTGSLGPALLSGIFDSTHDAGVRWVNTDPAFVKMRERELELQAEGRLDPSTPIHDSPLEPNTRVEGELTLSDGQLTGEIRLVDTKTGEVLDRIPVDRPFDRDSQKALDELIKNLGDDLARAILKYLPTTTTSSTTSTTTTTSTSTTTSTTSTEPPPPPPTIVTTTTTPTTTTTTLVPCGAGLLASAEVFRSIGAGATAIDLEGPEPPPQHFNVPQNTVSAGPGSTNTDQWNLSASAGGASAESTGTVDYVLSPCQISAHGTFHEASTGGSDRASATTALDARLQITFRVTQATPFTYSGFVRASGTPSSAGPTDAYLRCSSNFGDAEASLQDPTGAQIPFEESSVLYPEDEPSILCAVIRGGASASGVGDDLGDLDWSFTLILGD